MRSWSLPYRNNYSVGYVSFLHEDSLAALLRDDYIDGRQAAPAKELRAAASAIPDNQWELEAIRTEAVWREIMAISDRILDLARR